MPSFRRHSIPGPRRFAAAREVALVALVVTARVATEAPNTPGARRRADPNWAVAMR